jgi:hypothetical protein
MITNDSARATPLQHAPQHIEITHRFSKARINNPTLKKFSTQSRLRLRSGLVASIKVAAHHLHQLAAKQSASNDVDIDLYTQRFLQRVLFRGVRGSQLPLLLHQTSAFSALDFRFSI